MKKQITIYSIFIFATFFISFSSFYTHEKNSGQAPTGNTGAPGESTCAGCHTGGTYSGTITLLMNGGDVFEYEPAVKYTISFAANYGAPRYGFSLTALDSENNPAGQFTVTNDANTSYAVSQSNQRQYMGHKSAGANNSWTFEWTAPQSDVGNITFYYVINAANQNGGTSGDKIETGNTVIVPAEVAETYALTLESNPAQAGTVSGDGVFEEGVVIAINAIANDGFTFLNWTEGDTEISTLAGFDYTMPAEAKILTANFEAEQTFVDGNKLNELLIYPNPASDILVIESAENIREILISDISGKIVFNSQGVSDNMNINLITWESGIYFIKFFTEKETITKKFSVAR